MSRLASAASVLVLLSSLVAPSEGAARDLLLRSTSSTLNTHLPTTRLVKFKERKYPPVSAATRKDDVDRFVSLGVLDATGYSRLKFSVAGRFGSAQDAGNARLEIILVPVTDFVRKRRTKENILLLSSTVSIPLKAAGKDLFDGVGDFNLSFPRYDVWVRSHARGTLSASVYAFLMD